MCLFVKNPAGHKHRVSSMIRSEKDYYLPLTQMQNPFLYFAGKFFYKQTRFTIIKKNVFMVDLTHAETPPFFIKKKILSFVIPMDTLQIR